ncbi:MAG: autotransporter outer membrane beta-barrel domain-containing protein [Hyphomicrobiales bacterium]|jgi:hypothetical protein
MRTSVFKSGQGLALLLVLALTGLTSVQPTISPAYAVCSPATGDLTPTNSSVTCVGTTINQGGGAPGTSTGTDGYGTSTEDGVIVSVEDGATVTGDDWGFVLGRDITLTNNGTIRGINLSGFYVRDTAASLESNGLIEAGSVGIWINNGGVVFLRNDGTIESGLVQDNGHGIYVRGSAQELINTGLIRAGLNTSGAAGIYVENGPLERLRNDGTIEAGNDGILTVSANIESLINTGMIDAGRHGVYAFQGDIVSLQNSGTIRSVEHGVRTFTGEIGRLINAGLIQGGDHGVYSQTGGIGFLSNTGTIYGQTNSAVRAAQTIDHLTNSGVIEGASNGVSGNGGIRWLSNSGHIRGLAGAAVTTSTGSIDTVINSGRMFGTVDGVYAVNDIGMLTNSGFIGSDLFGVRALNGGLNFISNSGTIQGESFAIQEGGAGDTTLTLNAGSVLIGRVDLGGGVNTLNIGQGLSLNSLFESDPGASLVRLGSASSHLVAVVPVPGGGTQNDVEVVAVDPSAFAGVDDALVALTASIGQTVQGRQAALRSDPALGFVNGFAAAEETRLAAFSDLDLDRAPHLNPNRFWIEAFGAYRQDDGDRVGSEFDHLSGGLVAGVDVTVDALTSVGVMAGFAASTSENEIDTQKTDTTSFFAGLYASTQAMGLAWDASLTVGYTDYEQQRTTANNLVAGGLETASADFGGWFINPQLTATNSTPTGFTATPMGFGLASIEQSLTLSYAGLWLDGYTETGTTNPLTLNDRDVHVASARAAITLPVERVDANGALTALRLIGGLEARTQFGDDTVSGTLLGQAVSTTLGGDDQTLGGFLGLSGEYQTTTGLTAYANAEALIETDASWQLSATAGLRVAF